MFNHLCITKKAITIFTLLTINITSLKSSQIIFNAKPDLLSNVYNTTNSIISISFIDKSLSPSATNLVEDFGEFVTNWKEIFSLDWQDPPQQVYYKYRWNYNYLQLLIFTQEFISPQTLTITVIDQPILSNSSITSIKFNIGQSQFMELYLFPLISQSCLNTYQKFSTILTIILQTVVFTSLALFFYESFNNQNFVIETGKYDLLNILVMLNVYGKLSFVSIKMDPDLYWLLDMINNIVSLKILSGYPNTTEYILKTANLGMLNTLDQNSFIFLIQPIIFTIFLLLGFTKLCLLMKINCRKIRFRKKCFCEMVDEEQKNTIKRKRMKVKRLKKANQQISKLMFLIWFMIIADVVFYGIWGLYYKIGDFKLDFGLVVLYSIDFLIVGLCIRQFYIYLNKLIIVNVDNYSQ